MIALVGRRVRRRLRRYDRHAIQGGGSTWDMSCQYIELAPGEVSRAIPFVHHLEDILLCVALSLMADLDVGRRRRVLVIGRLCLRRAVICVRLLELQRWPSPWISCIAYSSARRAFADDLVQTAIHADDQNRACREVACSMSENEVEWSEVKYY